LQAAIGKLEVVKKQALTRHEKTTLQKIFLAEITFIATSKVEDKFLRVLLFYHLLSFWVLTFV
jgi:hypothetical protein